MDALEEERLDVVNTAQMFVLEFFGEGDVAACPLGGRRRRIAGPRGSRGQRARPGLGRNLKLIGDVVQTDLRGRIGMQGQTGSELFSS